MEPILLRVSEVAPLLGVSRSKAYELVARGEIPSVRIGGLMRVPLADLRRSIAERACVQSPPPSGGVG